MTVATSREHNGYIEQIQERILSWWQDRKAVAREMGELTSLGTEGLSELGKDCGVDPRLLATIIRRGAHSADEMPELMKALNIDAEAVHFDEPSLYRELKMNCSLCEEKGRCHSELAAGTAASNYAHFCHNEAVLSELRAHPEFQRAD